MIAPYYNDSYSNTDKKLSICLVSDDFLPAATGVGSHLQVVAAELVKPGASSISYHKQTH